MDLKNFETEDSGWLVINSPSGEVTDIKIKVASRDSETFRKAQRRITEAERKRAKGLKPAESERMWLDTFAKCTVDWENLQIEGKDIPCNYENAMMVYENYNFVLEQVMAFIVDRENFLSN